MLVDQEFVSIASCPESLQRQPMQLDVLVRALKRYCVLSQPVRLALGAALVVVRSGRSHRRSMADSSSRGASGNQGRCAGAQCRML